MTRAYNAADIQAGIMGWFRANPALDSREHGIVLLDSDAWVHRYKTISGNLYQYLMLVEIKEFGKDLSETQRDTLHIINQLLRNRRNIKQQWQADDGVPRISICRSLMNNKDIHVLCFGAHKLRIGGDGTFAQWQSISWDDKSISVEQLEQILRFELDPDTLGTWDHRPDTRHKCVEFTVSEQSELGFEYERKIQLRS